MKRLILAMALALAACGADEKAATDTAPSLSGVWGMNWWEPSGGECGGYLALENNGGRDGGWICEILPGPGTAQGWVESWSLQGDTATIRMITVDGVRFTVTATLAGDRLGGTIEGGPYDGWGFVSIKAP